MKRKGVRPLRHLLWIAVLLSQGGPGCQEPMVEIVEPEDGAELREIDQIRIHYEAIDPESLEVVLNGEPITEVFEIGPTEAVADAASVALLLAQGDNTLQAFAVSRTGSPADQARFFLDSRPPEIFFSAIEPVGGKGLETALSIRGTIRDVSPITAFSINGIPPTIDGETFSVTVPLDESGTVEIEVSDDFDNAMQRTYLRPGVPVSEGFVVRWMEETFALFLPDLLGELDLKPVEPRLIELNPVATGTIDALLPVSYTANVLTERNDRPSGSFTPLEETPTDLSIAEGIDNTAIHLRVDLVQGGFQTSGEIDVAIDHAFVGDTLTVSSVGLPQKGGETRLTPLPFAVTAERFTVDLSGISVSGDPLPPDIEAIVEEETTDALETVLIEIGEEVFADFVNEALSTITFETTEGTPFAITLSGGADNLVNENAGTSFRLDTLNDTETSAPGVQVVPGSRFSRGRPPSLPSRTPSGAQNYGFAISFSDDWIDQYLYTIYWNDGFSYTLSTTVEEVFGEILPPEVLARMPGSDLEVSFSVEEPPAMRFDDPEETTVVAIDRANLVVRVKNDTSGAFELLFQTRFDGIFPTAVELTLPGDALTFTLSEASAITFDSVEVGEISLPILLIDDMVETLLPLVLPLIGEAIGEVPLPMVSGDTLEAVELTPDGDGDFLSIYGFLSEGGE